MKNSERKITFRESLRLQMRGMKELSTIIPRLFYAIGIQTAVEAVTPYVLIFFSARILSELSGHRRPSELWKWVIWTVVITGFFALLNKLLISWTNVQMGKFWAGNNMIFCRKMYTMDFADVDNQNTHDALMQIKQNMNYGGFGFPNAIFIFEDMLKSVIGIISAIALTASLFISRVPDSAGRLTVLNNPLFILILLATMILLSWFAGKMASYQTTKESSLADEGRYGNRIFNYFGFFGDDGKRAVDIRMNEQHIITQHYMSDTTSGFGINGPFAKLARGLGGITQGVSVATSAVFTGFIYVFTCLKALGGAFGIGSISQYVGAVTALSGNLTMLFSSITKLRSNAEFLKRTFDFLDIPNSMYQGSLTTEKRADRKYEVEFRNVSFKYPGTDDWALRHVNIKFEIGKRLAVVGENGSGKTTFIKLLCRLYDPQEGEILLNGIDIRKYGYRDYLDIFSVVFQDYQLLSQPLGANVAGSAEYDRARVLKALNDAGFGERLKTLPDGLDTQLYNEYSEEGVEISGGEAQKIAIARALYKNSPFLILDEPTAALDPIAEAEIYAQLNQIVDDRTAIYISHRLSSCRFCDEIIVFDHGQIVQRGTHDSLVVKDGKYSQLWNAQAQYYTD